MASDHLHERFEDLRPETIERHRAMASLLEELEAIDWYDQRIDATQDEHLKAILVHNRDEEKEHAAMTLEWLRRRDPELDACLRQYLFTDGDVTVHPGAASSEPPRNGGVGALTIGSLREER